MQQTATKTFHVHQLPLYKMLSQYSCLKAGLGKTLVHSAQSIPGSFGTIRGCKDDYCFSHVPSTLRAPLGFAGHWWEGTGFSLGLLTCWVHWFKSDFFFESIVHCKHSVGFLWIKLHLVLKAKSTSTWKLYMTLPTTVLASRVVGRKDPWVSEEPSH